MTALSITHAADPTRLSPVGRDRQERIHLAEIERRITWLTARITETENSGHLDHPRRAERRALRWALARIAQAEETERRAEQTV